MFQPVDHYCERTDSSLWSEPLNFVSNGSFFVAAAFAWRLSRHVTSVERRRAVRIAIALCALVGVGSSLFHSFAVRWAELADIIPIAIFVLYFFGMYCRMALKWPWGRTIAAIFLFLIGTGFFSLSVDRQLVNNSQNYFGPLLGLFALGESSRRCRLGGSPFLFAAGLLFAVSITFRSLDLAFCDTWPVGTHFFWHLCNGGVLYLALSAAIRSNNDK